LKELLNKPTTSFYAIDRLKKVIVFPRNIDYFTRER